MRQSFTTQPALFASHELFEPPALGALDEVERLIDWSRIEALLPRGEERRQTGRPGYPAQTLFRALLLPLVRPLRREASAQLAGDLLFRKFCRLELDQGVPEASTLGRFRARLGDRLEAVLSEVVAMLEEAAWCWRRGGSRSSTRPWWRRRRAATTAATPRRARR